MTGHAHSIDIRVYYEDTDAAGIVYHASYLRFAERGRTELLRTLGYNHADLLTTSGVAFAVVSMKIDFKAPAILDDALVVTSRVTRLGGASMDMVQNVTRDGQPICDMDVTLVCMGQNKKAVRIPEDLREILSTH